MTPSKALFYFCISFVIGIALQSMVNIPQISVWGFLIMAVVCIAASFFKKEAAIVGFCLLALALGIMRFQISEFAIANDALGKLNDRPEKITLVGQVIGEPDVRDTSQKLKVRVDGTGSIVLITVQRYPEYHYLDTIKITGKLKTPGMFEDFNYQNYLAVSGIYSVMDFPVAELISAKHHRNIFSDTYEKILFVKGKLMESVDMNFSPPHSDMVKGIVFGNDKNMPEYVKEKFNITGLSHITAVSGSNIIILISTLMIFLLWLGFWRGQAFYLAVGLIWFYIILIGFPISGIRAAIMGSIALLAGKVGRQNATARVLTVAGSMMLLQNPLLLFYDISFQLSFLASLGIIHLKPLIDTFFIMTIKKVSITLKNIMRKNVGEPTKESIFSGNYILDIMSVTFAAQIFTLPIIVYNFGRISWVAPLTNILVLPVIPWLTVAGLLVSIIGIFSNILGFIFSMPCLFLLMYVVEILDIFSGPWAAPSLQGVSWIWVAGYYALLAPFIWRIKKFQKPRYL